MTPTDQAVYLLLLGPLLMRLAWQTGTLTRDALDWCRNLHRQAPPREPMSAL